MPYMIDMGPGPSMMMSGSLEPGGATGPSGVTYLGHPGHPGQGPPARNPGMQQITASYPVMRHQVMSRSLPYA